MKKDKIVFGKGVWIIACVGVVIFLAGCAMTKQSRNEHLFSAVELGDVNEVKKFIALGADVNSGWGSFGGLPSIIPLQVAIRDGNVEMVRLLVENGADVNQATGSGPTPLGLAAGEGKKEIVAVLLKSKTANVNAINILGETPLHEAAIWGQKEVAEILIKHGSDVNVQVTRWKSLRTIRDKSGTRTELVDAAIQSNDFEPKGMTPLGLALKYDHTEMADYLRSVGGKE